MNRPSLCSLRKVSLILVVVAAALLRANSEETGDAATAVPTGNATATETQPFRCIGICGEDEGELEDPDKTVEYQWNWRVPVCAGVSCDTSTCSQLQVKLGLLDIGETDCKKHRRLLQGKAGCTCSEAEPVVIKPLETRPVDEINDDGTSTGMSDRGSQSWAIVVIVVVVLLTVMLGLWLAVRHDKKRKRIKRESAIQDAAMKDAAEKAAEEP